MRAWLGVVVLAVLGGCGARSALTTGEESDGSVVRPDGGPFDGGGRDAPPLFDAGTDSGVPFDIECSEPVSTRPGVPVGIFAAVIEGRFVEGRWTVTEQPMGSSPTITDEGSMMTSVSGDLPGRYRFVFEAVDAIGQVATCESVVAVVAGPPVAVCPSEELVAPADTELVIPGAGFDDDGEVQFAWTVATSPMGSFTSLNPVDVAMPVFLGDTAGRYVLRLVVTDVFGMTDTCDARVRLTAPPVIDCPSAPFMAPTRQPFTVNLPVRDDTSIARHEWEILATPPRTDDLMLRPAMNRATLTPQRQGTHELLYRATDTDGLSSECIVTVIGTPTPPTLMCPEVVEGRPLTNITWSMGVQDDGFTVNARWMLASRPDGSAAEFTGSSRIDVPGTLPFTFMPDLAGEFPVDITVSDEDGQTATCTTLVRAVVDEGLRIEMFWNTGGRTDMDLHLLNPSATSWFNPNDCYYANCQSGLAWPPAGMLDDPSLDIDDTDGFGPENINIEEPSPGTYRVGVHAFSGDGGVTVRIYCGGSRTDARATFGPTRLTNRGGTSGDFWRVADVAIDGVGRCTVTELLNSVGRPDIVTRGIAESTR